ncbi:hypothetical protein H4S01_002373 [Coemansia sp. RSA 2610]|nr:hypothetical protein H4S01_002373 [Coemansia sp. RSA 2610]
MRRFRHLFSRVAGSLGRSDSVQPNKLKNSVWHQRSQGSSRASSPSSTSLNDDTPDLKGAPEVTAKVEVEVEVPTPDTQTEDTQHRLPAADADNITRVKHSHAKPAEPMSAPEAPLQAPPTPRSFNDAPNEPAPAAASQSAVRSPTSDEFMQTDSPVIVSFERSEISPAIADNYVQMDSPVVQETDRRASMVSSPASTAAPTAPAAPSNAAQRYGSMRERQKSINRSNRNSVNSMVLSPSQPEVALMLDQVKAHRKDVAELAFSSGVMGDKYFECLRGYTSIQEPAKSFWKRRYFAIADKVLFMYTNECSRTPSDYLPMDSIVAMPRDAEDEVLMPHSVAVDFGDGEYYLYFDSASVRQAFEGEVQKAISAA